MTPSPRGAAVTQSTCMLGPDQGGRSENRIQEDMGQDINICKGVDDSDWLAQGEWVSVLRSPNDSGLKIVEWL
jgi:hypothetical protein